MTKTTFFKFWLFLALGLTSTVFSGCDKDDNKGSNENESNSLVKTISAKWEISDSNSPYASFEFNKDGNYIVVKNDVEPNLKSSSTDLNRSFLSKKGLKSMNLRSSETNLSPIHFGTYRIEGNNIILSGFGVIEIISITAEEFSFSFTLDATGEKNSFVANKSAEPISSSSRTDMLCRTWEVQKMTIDVDFILNKFSSLTEEEIDYITERYGENWKQKFIEDELETAKKFTEFIENKTLTLTVLFSKAGTYLVLYDGPENIIVSGNRTWEFEDAGLSEWKWANNEETKLYYSWNNWENNWEDNAVTINQLDDNTLVVQEEYELTHLKIKK